ncbi:protein FAR1-RELATED SEQUENCE 11-like [Rhododendron vialii]|uniref:protein FAR1-RELATED SEQUENCE 11-like n=1 Tax=Rhododendron vialii TaxID=182163 RepID=UPI00265E6591|nr:protein FAR1-RELATED SEQUENCE 11-like [Rhododendron vialii]
MKEFEFEDFMNLGSSYDKKAHEIDEGDNGSVDEVEVIVPQCGMIFDTADEAYNFYNGYARKINFSVRKQRTNKSKAEQNKILRQVLVCSCEGTYKKIRTPRKRRENRRFDCKTLLEFKLIGDKYHVIQFMSDHTHDLVPPQFAHYLRSQRRIEFSQVGLLELEAKVESWISSRCENHNVASQAQNSSTLNVDDEAPLRDPTKRQRRGQGNKRKRGSLEDKLPKKKTPCKRKGSKGEDSTTKSMTRSKPLKEVEEDENAHDTTSTQGLHVEQPNMAANVGMNALQVPNVAGCL